MPIKVDRVHQSEEPGGGFEIQIVSEQEGIDFSEGEVCASEVAGTVEPVEVLLPATS